MRLLIYGEPGEKEKMLALLESGRMAFRRLECRFCARYDDYLAAIKEGAQDAILVTAGGASGMEGVKAARTLAESTPVLWFSEDRAFCAESYRLNCRFFGEKPVAERQLAAALERCCGPN